MRRRTTLKNMVMKRYVTYCYLCSG